MVSRRMGLLGLWMILWGMTQGAEAHAFMSLPRPSLDGKISVEKAIQKRRTIRDFKEDSLSLGQLSQLLWAGQGITDPIEGKRAAPSAGALYPLDLYVLVGPSSVEGLEAGVYQYRPEPQAIVQIAKGDRRKEIALASLWQMWMARAPVLFIITAEYRRITGKYGDRGIRYAWIEAGHVGQNLFLQAEALGLGAGIVGAFQDREVARLMAAPPSHEPLLIMPVGYKK